MPTNQQCQSNEGNSEHKLNRENLLLMDGLVLSLHLLPTERTSRSIYAVVLWRQYPNSFKAKFHYAS